VFYGVGKGEVEVSVKPLKAAARDQVKHHILSCVGVFEFQSIVPRYNLFVDRELVEMVKRAQFNPQTVVFLGLGLNLGSRGGLWIGTVLTLISLRAWAGPNKHEKLGNATLHFGYS